MATAATSLHVTGGGGGPAAGASGNAALNAAANLKDESMATGDGGRPAGDLSAEIAENDQVLQMVDSGFDPERIFESREYQFSMDMIADNKLRGNQMYEKLTQRLSAFYLNTEKIRIDGLTDAQKDIINRSGFSQQYR